MISYFLFFFDKLVKLMQGCLETSTCWILINFNMLHTYQLQYAAYLSTSTCCILINFNMLHTYQLQHVGYLSTSTCCILINFNMLHTYQLQHENFNIKKNRIYFYQTKKNNKNKAKIRAKSNQPNNKAQLGYKQNRHRLLLHQSPFAF